MLSTQKYGENLHVNYSPFGAILYGRNWSSEKYRYGFNGMEKDDELKGNGNSYDFGARMYDSRLGRFLSIDLAFEEYPAFSGYSFSANNPIMLNDPTGKWIEVTTTKYYKDKNTSELKVKNWYNIFKKAHLVTKDIVIHNAKVYNYDQENTDTQEFANQLKENLVKGYNTSKVPVPTDKNSFWDEDMQVMDRETNATKFYQTTLRFEGEIKVVDNIEDVNMKGPKSDNLYVLVSYKTMRVLRDKKVMANAFTPEGKNVIFFGTSTPVDAVHETAHQLRVDSPTRIHQGMTNTIWNGSPDSSEIKRIEQPSNESYGNDPSFKKLEKIKESKSGDSQN